MGKSRVYIVTVGAVLALVGLAWFFLEAKAGDGRAHILPDGTVVQLAGVSYGKVHRMASGGPMLRLFGPFLPDAAAMALGATIHAVTNGSDTLMVFFDLTHARNTLAPGGGYQTAMLTTSDARGNEFKQSGEAYRSQTSNELVLGFEIPLASHLASPLRLRLQVFDYAQSKYFPAEFEAGNPAPAEAAAEQRATNEAATLPATTNAGDASVSLVGFDSLPREWSVSFDPEARSNHWTALRYRISGPWKLYSMSVEDLAGKTYEPPESRGVFRPGSDVLERDFVGAFSPEEVWRVKFELERTAGFASNEVWTSAPFFLPGSPTNYLSPMSADVAGFHAVVDQFSQKRFRLTLTPSPGRAGYSWDAQLGGQNLMGWGGDNGKKINFTYEFDETNTTEPQRLTLRLAKTRAVDFLARPRVTTDLTNGAGGSPNHGTPNH